MGVRLGDYGDRAMAAAFLLRLADIGRWELSALIESSDTVAGDVSTARQQMNAEAAEVPPSVALLAALLQRIIETPVAATSLPLPDRVDAYRSLSAALRGLLSNPELDTAGYNRALAVELGLCAVVSSLCRVLTSGTVDTRSQALDLAGELLDEFAATVNALDDVQSAFELTLAATEAAIDARYFSQTKTYHMLVRMVTVCVRYLLRSAFDLRIEKRITMHKPTAPIALALLEYPGVEPEAALDLLVRANELTAEEILLLPSGREVLIYV